MFLIQNIKQTFKQLHSQPLLSSIQVIGTALAIFMIMVYIMLQDIFIAPYAPETHRDRFLHVRNMCTVNKASGAINSSGLSPYLFRQCFEELKTPELVACYSLVPYVENVGVAHGTETSARIKYCSDKYWRVLDFDFVNGRPFNEGECTSAISVAVITDEIANKLFGTDDASGKDITIDRMVYRVIGVVKKVSPLAVIGCSDVWTPYTILERKNTWSDPKDALGEMSVVMLMRDRSDMEKIREECESLRLKFGGVIAEGWEIDYKNQPYDQEKYSYLWRTDLEPDMPYEHKVRLLVILALLLVPAINLSSMTQSRFRQRMVEIGVRRAFGSTRISILNQVFMENFVLTLIAGGVGVLFCILFSRYAGGILFETSIVSFMSSGAAVEVNMEMLIHVSTFLWAFLFCFILNMMSSLYPAWKASRVNIIKAIKN